jgi:predicted phage terminase large subunit-like protein
MWCHAYNNRMDPSDLSGAILGPTDQDARARLRQIRYELERNALIKADFRPKPGIKWSDDEMVLAGVMDAKNPTLVASGLTSFQPGPRLTLVVLDDVTEPLHADSKLYREKQMQTLEQVVIPTMREGGMIVSIATAYYRDDFPATLAKDKTWLSKKWPLVINEARHVVQWPEAWPWRRVLEVMKISRIYLRQYQLEESRAEDSLFHKEWFKLVDGPPMESVKVRAWDMAATPKRPGSDRDWTVGTLMSKTSGGIYTIEHVERFRARPRERDERMKHVAEVDGMDIPIIEEQEGGSAGPSVIDGHGILLDGWNYKGISTGGESKRQRADPFSAAAEQGRVQIVRADWNQDFLDELEGHPFGAHKDVGDSASLAYNYLSGRQDNVGIQDYYQMLADRVRDKAKGVNAAGKT